jgi:RNA polymerase sigma-70 factor (ECF subfamily)
MAEMDATRLADLFDGLGPGLVLYARQWLGADESQDVVQEAFIRLMRQRAEPANVKAWLCRTVRHAALDARRAHCRRTARETARAKQQDSWFEPRAADLIDAQSATDALSHLPEDQREAIVLRIWNGLALQEIAELTGAPVSTVFSRYKSALAAIRHRLEKPCPTSTTTIR